jgi:hypothetical protein
MADLAEQCMMAVIGSIKQNPDLSEAEAWAIVDSFYPGEGDVRLDLYTQSMYNVASILENTYEALRAKITELSLEDLGRIMPQVRIVADELLKPILRTAWLTQRKTELEAILAEPSPVKTVPDQETVDFWNDWNPEVHERQELESEYDAVVEELGG